MQAPSHTLFSALDETQRQRVDNAVINRQHAGGALIAGQGVTCEGLFCIDGGLVQFNLISPDGRSTFVGLEKSGNYFGDCELLLAQPHFATITAMTDCRLRIVPAAVFHNCMLNAAFATAIAGYLARHLQLLQWVQMARHQYSAERQIANIVVHLGQNFGHSTTAGQQVDVPLTQDQLADMAGVSRQAIHKPLQLWKQCGWIDYQYGRLRINDMAALEKIARGQ
jgi:CRP/FNR family cyclic AMP-dependent transcriptional regulator